jgi:putative glutamine amidotransferase
VFDKLLKSSQGIVFNGGPDIPPSLYGRPTLWTTVIETPERHIFEVALLVQMLGSARAPGVVPLLAHHESYPVLAICVGMQSLNIAGGGTLIQDIPSQIYGVDNMEDALKTDPRTWHRSVVRELSPEPEVGAGVLHVIRLTPKAPAFLRGALGDDSVEPQVLCIHHQAVDLLAPGYTVFATSDDGKVVEAMGRMDFPNVLGLQFHPELTALWDAKEIFQERPGPADEHNFAYSAMGRDPRSRVFHLAVWLWLAHAMHQEAVLHGSHS